MVKGLATERDFFRKTEEKMKWRGMIRDGGLWRKLNEMFTHNISYHHTDDEGIHQEREQLNCVMEKADVTKFSMNR